MYHLMCHGILQMTLVPHLICANLYAIVGVKSTSFSLCAATAVDIVTRKIAAQLTDIVAEEPYDGA